MRWKRIGMIAAVVVIGAAFLAGYVPQRRLRAAAEEEARTLRAQLAASDARVRLGQLLGQVLTIREVVARQNYGQAQELASTFFDSVRKEAASGSRDEFRPMLNEVLSQRDAVTAALTRADQAVVQILHAIEVRLREALGFPLPQAPAAA